MQPYYWFAVFLLLPVIRNISIERRELDVIFGASLGLRVL